MDTNEKYRTKVIPHSRPTVGAKEARAAARVVESGMLAQGEVVDRFEKALSRMVGVENAAATGSGTAALHLTLLAMDIGPGDEVIIPSYVCCALLNAVNYVGAIPVLADIDPQTYNIDKNDVQNRLTTRTRALIVPHLFGLPANLQALEELNIPIIEDCAQAIGSTYQGKPVGSIGFASVFSFYATKVMTTGEGGMVVSDSKDLIARIKDLREYDNRDNYQKRYNYKLTDFQAAVGLNQLRRLPDFIKQRRTIARQYDWAFQNLNLRLPANDPGHIYYRYVIDLGTRAETWIKSLAGRDIMCSRPVYKPLHSYLRRQGYSFSDRAWETSISIPIYPTLTDKHVGRIIDALVRISKG